MMIIVIIIIVSAANNHSFAFQRGAPWRKSHVIAVVRFVERADVVKPHFQHLAAARIFTLFHYNSWRLSINIQIYKVLYKSQYYMLLIYFWYTVDYSSDKNHLYFIEIANVTFSNDIA